MATPQKTRYPGVTYIEVPRPTGGTEKSYYVTYREPSTGKLKNIAVGRQFRDDMTAARASGIRAELIEGKRQTRAEAKAEADAVPTIEKIWDKYQDANMHKASMRTDKYTIEHFRHLFDKTPRELTIADISNLRRRLEKARKAPQTVRNVLELLRRLCNYGAKQGLYPKNALSHLHFAMPVVNNEKTEYLEPDQRIKLLEALDVDRDQILAGMMKLAVCTGIRRSALLDLKWTDIDWRRGFITLRGEVAKNGKTAKIPLNQTAAKIIQAVPKIQGSAYIFAAPDGGKRGDIRRFLNRIRKAAELPEDFRPLHGLRHTYASGLVSTGNVDLYSLQKLLTQKSPQMTQRYAHLADEALHRAAGVAADLFSELASKAPQDD